MKKHRGGWNERKTEEEAAWLKNAISPLAGKHIGLKVIRELNLAETFNKKFGKKVTESSLYTWLAKQTGQMGGKKKPNLAKVMEQAKFVLYVFNEGIFGFDSKDEVKTYLANRTVQVPIRIFENIPVSVKVNVDVKL